GSAQVDAQATAFFRRSLEELDVRPAMSHAMYLSNLGSPNPNFRKKSRAALAAELVRAESFGCQYVVTHVGSHMGDGAQAGIDRVVAALDEVMSGAGGSKTCMLETSDVVGADEVAEIDVLGMVLAW